MHHDSRATFTGDKTTATALQAWLTDQSAWFACTPLPGDHYEIAVKAEHRLRVARFLSKAGLHALERTGQP